MRKTRYARALPGPQPKERHDWQTIATLAPYLWNFKWRVVFALACLIGAKMANVGVPLVFKGIIDSLSLPANHVLLLVPMGLLAAMTGRPMVAPASPADTQASAAIRASNVLVEGASPLVSNLKVVAC